MRPRLYNLIAACLLIVSVGGHWALAQSLAWAGMLVSYSQEGTIAEAVEKTFDGAHPCKLCKVIDAGQEAERQSENDRATSDMKITWFLVDSPRELWAPAESKLPAAADDLNFLRFAAPPHVPPRVA